MSSYAIVFQQETGQPLSGRLELVQHGLVLHGGRRGSETSFEIPYDEIVGVERDPGLCIGPCRAIAILSSNAGRLLIASFTGIGVLREIAEVVSATLAG